ncbi:MAG: hypothetical protein KatS3mg015_1077 [Fimbriimonadales bacterium]|nr:MAG: hypothetical protein KatS3mg015_1077 [Fimbriimonadales bacterium]
MRFFRALVLAAGLSVAVPAASILPGLVTADYPWVGKWGSSSFNTTAVAIGPYWLLTARHTVGSSGNTGWKFKLDDYPTEYHSVLVIRHATDDIALVKVDQPLPGWYEPYTGTQDVGAIGTLVGYGNTGVWNGSQWSYTSSYGTKRFGTNRMTFAQFVNLGSIQGFFLIGDFDGNGVDTWGDGGPLQTEVTLGSGDSGGPTLMLVNGRYQVIGIHSWIGSVSGGPPPPQYGSVFGDIRVAAYASFIQSNRDETAPVTDFEVLRGLQLGGNLQSLEFAEDNRVVVEARRPTEVAAPSVEIEVRGSTTHATPSEIRFVYEGAATGAPVLQRIQFFNYQTNSWETVDERDATGSDSLTVVSIVTNPARFVQPGTGAMKARIQYHDRGVTFVSWGGQFDQVVWSVTP